MKIGVFVGSFNPVHKLHIKMASILVNDNYVDKLLIIPTQNYWDKNNLIDVKYRIEMLKKYETDKIIIDEEFNNLEYTYQIIESLKEKYPKDEFSLIIGADNIIDFNKWKNYKYLLNLELIIFRRNNVDVNLYLNSLGKEDRYKIINLDENNVSSTMIRENINNKEILKKYLDDKIIDYIVENNIYRNVQ